MATSPMTLLIILLAISVCVNFVLFQLYYGQTHHSKNLKRLYSEIHEKTGFDNVIQVLSTEIAKMGVEVLGFYGKNIGDSSLKAEEHFVPLYSESAAVLAFYSQMPHVVDPLTPVDKVVIEHYKTKDLTFVPIQMQQEGSCWQIKTCNEVSCRAHGRINKQCWNLSGKHCRSIIYNSFEEKSYNCVRCRMFLPVGVFLLRGASSRKAAKVHRFLKTFSGIYREAVLYSRAEFAATRDQMTGTFNKQSFLQNLSSLFKLSVRYKHQLSLCMFDIDHFKNFNDTYGHLTGDLVLKELARIISTFIRETDIFARYGGEEFTIIFPDTTKDTAFAVSEKIRKKVSEHVFKSPQGDLNVQISMGVASLDDMPDTPEAFIGFADAALYHSKKIRGRNCVTLYDSKLPDMKSMVEKSQKKEENTVAPTAAPKKQPRKASTESRVATPQTPPPLQFDFEFQRAGALKKQPEKVAAENLTDIKI